MTDAARYQAARYQAARAAGTPARPATPPESDPDFHLHCYQAEMRALLERGATNLLPHRLDAVRTLALAVQAECAAAGVRLAAELVALRRREVEAVEARLYGASPPAPACPLAPQP